MGFNKSRTKRKSKKKTSRKRKGGKLAKGCEKEPPTTVCNYCKGINYNDPKCKCCVDSPEYVAALNQAKKDSNTIETAKKNLSLWTEAPCNVITPQEVKKWDNWVKENNLSPELVEPLKQKYKGCIEEAKQEIQTFK